jgi:hypothetical protein
MIQQGINPVTPARDGAIDPFACQKQSALDPMRRTPCKQWVPQRGRIGKAGKVIQRGNREHAV